MPQGSISGGFFATARKGLIEEVTEWDSVANMKAVEHDARDGREEGGIDEGCLLEELDKEQKAHDRNILLTSN